MKSEVQTGSTVSLRNRSEVGSGFTFPTYRGEQRACETSKSTECSQGPKHLSSGSISPKQITTWLCPSYHYPFCQSLLEKGREDEEVRVALEKRNYQLWMLCRAKKGPKKAPRYLFVDLIQVMVCMPASGQHKSNMRWAYFKAATSISVIRAQQRSVLMLNKQISAPVALTRSLLHLVT